MSDIPFGHRRTPPPGSGLQLSAPQPGGWPEQPQVWPVRLEKQLGVPPIFLLGPLAFVSAVNLLPMVVLSKLPLQDVLLHTSTGAIFIAMALAAVILCVATRRLGVLVVDREGIDVRVRATHAFYAWDDIEHLDEIKNGVKVSLKGRSAEQNEYNVVSARFAGSAGELRQLFSKGLNAFATGREATGRSLAPGDDLRRARIRSAVVMLAVLAVPFAAIIIFVAIWQGQECLKGLALQKHGELATATVTRIYTDGCSRSGCGISAEFTYVSAEDGRVHTGRGHLASDRDRDDPDLAFARSNGVVPVVYDTERPQVVEMNFNDRVFRGDPVKLALDVLGLIGGMCGAMFALYVALLAPSLVRAFRTSNDPSWSQKIAFPKS